MKISLFSSQLNSSDYLEEEDIIKFNNMVDEIGYDGVLFVYHSKSIDYLLPIVRNLNKNHRFQYILAMRTYAISPEYFAMLIKSFNRIQKNRLAVNIVAGDIHSDENSINDVIAISEIIDSVEKRTKYTTLWLDKFINLVGKDKPRIIISGYSETSTNNAEKYGDEQLCMLSTYLEEMQNKIKCKGKFISVPVYVVDDYIRCEDDTILQDFLNSNTMVAQSLIWGHESDVINKIIELENYGITNCMLSIPFSDQEEKLHKMAKKLIYKLSTESRK